MSGSSQGGVTTKVLTGRSAAPLQRYPESLDEGQEAALFRDTRHCSEDIPTQIREWQAVREDHGTQGAKRVQKASYETVDPDTGLHASGQPGTHVMQYTGGKMRKRPVRSGETATHLRIEAESSAPAKQSEAVHTIYAASAELINPDNPEDLERFFIAVTEHRDEFYPGLQESMWLERNGKSGLAHIHVASNATIYQDFTLDGKDYKAGLKMAGALTRVDDVRAGFERYLDAHPEHGLKQTLARVGTQEYKDAQLRSGQRDFWEGKRGKESSHDQVRRITIEALGAAGVNDRTTFIAEMQAHGVEVAETGLRRSKPGRNHDYTYRLSTAKQATRGRTLGVDYGHDAISAQLSRRAAGLEIVQPAGPQAAGVARPLPFEQQPWTAAEQQEFDALRAEVEALAQQGRAARAPRAVPVTAARAASVAVTPPAPPVAAPSPAQPTPPQPSLVSVEDATVEEAQERHGDAEPAQPVAAPAAQRPAHSPAQVSEQPFSSGLRDVKAKSGSKEVQRRIDGLAQLEEDYRGEKPDAEFESRIKGFGGINDQFLRDYGEHLGPGTRKVLTLRTEAQAARRDSYESAKDYRDQHRQAGEKYARLREDGERDFDTAWKYGSHAEATLKEVGLSKRRFEQANERTSEVRDLIDDGKYGAAKSAAKSTEKKKSPLSASDEFDAQVRAAERERNDSGLGL